MVNQVCFPLVTRMSMFVEDISRFAPQILSEIAHLSIILAKELIWGDYMLRYFETHILWCDQHIQYTVCIYIYTYFFQKIIFELELQLQRSGPGKSEVAAGVAPSAVGAWGGEKGGFLGFFGAQILKWFGDADCFWNPWRTMGYMRYIHQTTTVFT